jgi:hypothetical protein
MSYLDIARAAASGCEKSELSEKGPRNDHREDFAQALQTEALNSRRGVLSRAEAGALGLNPTLIWIRVSREEVEATASPVGWDGTLPAACAWPALCQTLGPCPRQRENAPCRST